MAKTLVLDVKAKYALDPQIYAALSGLAIGLARSKLEASGVADLTDNTTGTAALSFVDIPVPSSAFDATSSGGVQTANFNTSIGKFENAGKVLVNSFNKVRAVVGLPLMTSAVGTQATADTVPAQDLTATAANGTSSVDYASARAAMKVAKANIGMLMTGLNQIRNAIGAPDVGVSAYKGNYANLSLADVPTVASATTGASSITTAQGTAFLAALANDLATIAQYWNWQFNQGSFSSLTDSTGGTAASGLVANPLPSPANGAATTSSPKAGFDTALTNINDGIGELVIKMNTIRGLYDLSQYTNNTGITANSTLAAISNNLTAVDGSTGTVAVDQVTALARMTTINNAVKSLGVGINDLVGFVGVPSLTDALSGTLSTTIANCGVATGTGVGGASGTPTLLDTDVDTWLDKTRNNIASLTATLNAVIAASPQVSYRPLTVVAGT